MLHTRARAQTHTHTPSTKKELETQTLIEECLGTLKLSLICHSF